jgi:hypothetical protein
MRIVYNKLGLILVAARRLKYQAANSLLVASRAAALGKGKQWKPRLKRNRAVGGERGTPGVEGEMARMGGRQRADV